ncbi:MAG TPA: hypothetical protein VFM16_05050 [Holophagaceae bacterium]|nr:hypothetical protein [Holophagaceae bacterium]
MTSFRSAILLALAARLLPAQAPPAWHAQIGAVWSQPQGDLKQVTPDRSWGAMLAAQAQETPDGALRLFAEYRRFTTEAGGRFSLSDGGVLLSGTISGPIYGTLGLSAERIHLPGRDAAIKLGARAGLGWTLGRHASLESAYTTASLDHRRLDTIETSLVITF